VAFARGILQAEIVNLNAEADRKNDADSKAIFAENLEVVRAAWTMDPFRWKGERHEFPHPSTEWPESAADAYEREGGERSGLVVLPQPVQQPMPPLYSVTESRSGFLSAAEQGLGVITWYPTRKVLDGLNAAYHEAADRAGGRPGHMGRSAVVLRSCCIAPTDEEAYQLVRDTTRQAFKFIKEVRGMGVWLDEGEDPSDPALNAMDPFELLLERDHLMVGSPDSVAERMLRMGETHGIDHWLLSVHAEEAERTLRLLSAEVAPALRRGRPAAV
jgi:alkanesulfonate monooxygenase SsuD/methylene tetrahydromethanopterin reductase-like flavin-dependent oxidoreductase (luciferase family)